jgi:hypothetical protein
MDDKVSVTVRKEENGGVKFGNINTSCYSSEETFIPLKNLFKYPTDKDPPPDGMNLFWR